MKISVVTVTHNSDEWLEGCIESILNQTVWDQGHDLDYVIIDGGSTDRTIEVLTGYKKRFPKIFTIARYDDDPGCSECRNTGLEMVIGNVVAIQDSDDVSLPRRFEICLPILEKYHYMCASYYTDFGKTRKFEAITPDIGFYMQVERLKENVSYGKPYADCTAMFRREVIDKGCRYPDIACGADWGFELSIQYHFLKSMIAINDVVLKYRQHSESMVHRFLGGVERMKNYTEINQIIEDWRVKIREKKNE